MAIGLRGATDRSGSGIRKAGIALGTARAVWYHMKRDALPTTAAPAPHMVHAPRLSKKSRKTDPTPAAAPADTVALIEADFTAFMATWEG